MLVGSESSSSYLVSVLEKKSQVKIGFVRQYYLHRYSEKMVHLHKYKISPIKKKLININIWKDEINMIKVCSMNK